jgi:hypothetical protein
MSDKHIKHNTPTFGLNSLKGKTPAFGQRKLSPIRETPEGKPSRRYGPRIVKKELLDPPGAEEYQSPPPDYQPENTQRIVLSSETLRVNLEDAANGSELPNADDIPIVWGGTATPAPKSPRILGAPESLPQLLRWLLVGFFLLSLTGSFVAVLQLLR